MLVDSILQSSFFAFVMDTCPGSLLEFGQVILDWDLGV